MDERKVREKMSKSIPGGSSKDLDALIAQYNKDLMNYYRKNASRILPTEETAPAAPPPVAAAASAPVAVTAPVDQETATQPAAPVMDFPVPIGPRPAAEPVENPPSPVIREEEGEIENMFLAQDTRDLPPGEVADAPPMTPAAEPPAEEDGAAEEETPPAPEQAAEPETDTGYIQVRTFTARQAIPVPGAVVTITRKNGDKDELIRIMQTDISGLSPVVAVPTVSRELSLQPGTIPPYTAYTIQSDAEGYYSVRNLNVPVYGGITAVQPVEMIPLPEQVTSGMLEFPETGPQDLD